MCVKTSRVLLLLGNINFLRHLEPCADNSMQSFDMLSDLHKDDAIVLDLRDQVALLRRKINLPSHPILLRPHRVRDVVPKSVATIPPRHLREGEFRLPKITLLNYRGRDNNKEDRKEKLNRVQ